MIIPKNDSSITTFRRKKYRKLSNQETEKQDDSQVQAYSQNSFSYQRLYIAFSSEPDYCCTKDCKDFWMNF